VPRPASDSERTDCPVCGEARVATWFEGDGFAMGTCRGCGLIRQDPRLTHAALKRERYDTAMAPLDSGKAVFRPAAYEGLEAWETKPRGAFESSVEAVEAALGVGAPRGLWVDVGCSTGGLLVVARDRGWKVLGVDLWSDAVQLVRATHGIDARAGTLADAGLAPGAAQVISYRQVLEHVHDLDAELARVRVLLEPGGLLLVEVPHGGGFRLRLGRLAAGLGLRRRERLLSNVPEHLYYFRAEHLARVLARHGFETLSRRTYGRYRQRRSRLRALLDAVRDRLRVGNKLRVVARRAP
jgi:SAM-dependent methyltransferase